MGESLPWYDYIMQVSPLADGEEILQLALKSATMLWQGLWEASSHMARNCEYS